MHILLLCNKPPYPAKDGASVVMKVTLQSLLSIGCELSVLLMSTPKHGFDKSTVPSELAKKVSFHEVFVNTSFNAFELLKNLWSSDLPFHVERFDNQEFRQKLIALLQSQKIDLVLMEGLYLSPYLPTIRQFSPQTKVVMRPHNWEYEIWKRRSQNEGNFLKKYYFNILAERHYQYELKHLRGKSFDALVFLSERDLKHFPAASYQVPYHIASHGIDLSDLKDFRPSSTPEPYSLCFLGAMDWEPNVEGLRWFLKEVWQGVRMMHPNLPFYVAGRNMRMNLFADLPTEALENVFLVGEVEDSFEFLCSKGVLVCPLLSGGGIRIKLIEGMGLGKSIVASSLALEGNPAKDGKEVLIADAPFDFIRATLNLLQDPELYESIGKNARNFSLQYFDNHAITVNMKAFFDKL